MKKDPLDDGDLIAGDEVLRSLTHRAAYRTIVFLRWVLLPVAMVLIFIVKDESWNIAGYTVIAVFFFTMAVFEMIMAYDGVFKGLDQLRTSVNTSKREIYIRVVLIIVQMIILSVVLGRFEDDDHHVMNDVMKGLGLGIGLSAFFLYRWRHIVDKKSR